MPFPKLRGLAGFASRFSAHRPDSKKSINFQGDVESSAHQLDPKSRTTFGADVNLCPSTGSEKSATFRADVPSVWRGFDEAKVARLHALYYDPAFSVAQVAKEFGVATSALFRWIAELEWPSRRQMRKQSMAVLREKGGSFSVHQPDPESHSENTATFLADENHPRDGARTLASLVRTLRALHGLRDGEASRAADAGYVGTDDVPPRSLEQLRDDLAARLEKLRADSGQA